MADKRTQLTKKELSERIDEISDAYFSEREDNKMWSEELRYLSNFIRWKGLDEEYGVFRKKAVEELDPDLPFPYLVMPASD